jgi:hypothetical protein
MGHNEIILMYITISTTDTDKCEVYLKRRLKSENADTDFLTDYE